MKLCPKLEKLVQDYKRQDDFMQEYYFLEYYKIDLAELKTAHNSGYAKEVIK